MHQIYDIFFLPGSSISGKALQEDSRPGDEAMNSDFIETDARNLFEVLVEGKDGEDVFDGER